MKKIVNKIARGNELNGIKETLMKDVETLQQKLQELELTAPTDEEGRLADLTPELIEFSELLADTKISIAQLSYKLGIETFVHSAEEKSLARMLVEQVVKEKQND